MAITYQDIKNYICSMENFWTKEEAKRLLFTKIPIFMQHYSNHLRNSHMYVTKASVRYRGIHKPRRKAKGVLRKSTLWRIEMIKWWYTVLLQKSWKIQNLFQQDIPRKHFPPTMSTWFMGHTSFETKCNFKKMWQNRDYIF